MAWEEFNWGSRGLHWKIPEIPEFYMAHRYIPDGYRIGLEFERDDSGQFWNFFAAKEPGGTPTILNCISIAVAVQSWVGSSLVNMLTSAYNARRVVVAGMNAPNAPVYSLQLTNVGTRGGITSPGSLSCSVKLGTYTLGRRRFGKKKMYGFSTADFTADRLSNAYISALLGVLTNLHAALNVNGTPMCVASLEDQVVYPVQTIEVLDRILDTQKTRLAQHGR